MNEAIPEIFSWGFDRYRRLGNCPLSTPRQKTKTANLDQPHPRNFPGYQPLLYKMVIVSNIFMKIS
jgi:hypothetical protein